ncbi:sulfatase-like hydrolase/transferase [Neisseria chenwenguii]|uniref:Uncharacterized protein n=1 Tax=Neisseria chenwenguii TaxID=1853278 RepID=A0A220S262_9NEIS|nr:sulfatase-like hydrolase/transferase [Neisseria chenwenguii]ASK27512.1 hypothetical protein BG910_06920 [Neisseria chenwenguii]ROV55592.1 LTA synthase family protein [Neisseria chenwenguii]
MSVYAMLHKEYALPKFSFRLLVMALLLVLLPNVAFLSAAYFTNTARPLLNLDYFWAALLFVLPWRFAKFTGLLLFWLAALFDTLMMVMQLFPFMDLLGAIYLAPFIMKAPFLYQALTVFLLGYLFLIPMFLGKIAGKTNIYHVLYVCVPLFVAAYFTGHLQYHHRSNVAILFGGNNFYYAKSQYALYRENQDFDFLKAADNEPVLLEESRERASLRLSKPTAKKILFIVNESWGQPKNSKLQDAVLEKIYAEKSLFSQVETGYFRAIGATVEGELRELCGFGGARGFSFRRTPAEKFSKCMPNILQKQGYKTIALHGASGQLYDRYAWYPKAGFNKIQTAEYMMGKPTCEAFGGVCDRVLYDEVKQGFRQNDKLFFYWLTLSTHADYSEKDLYNQRLKCEDFQLPSDTLLCRNFRLQAQFFDGLAALLKQPEMKGAEVIVVGDHSPPVINIGEVFKYLEEGDVAWLHLKVKE